MVRPVLNAVCEYARNPKSGRNEIKTLEGLDRIPLSMKSRAVEAINEKLKCCYPVPASIHVPNIDIVIHMVEVK